MPAGRPTKYTDETPQQVLDYMGEYKELDEAIPSIAGLACYIGVARETIHDWVGQEGKEKFSHNVKQMLSKQEIILSSKGLTGDFTVQMAKLLLTRHGLNDKTTTEISGPEGGAVQVDNKWTVEVVNTADKGEGD